MWLMLEKEIENIESMLANFKGVDISAFTDETKGGGFRGLTMNGKIATIAITGPMLPRRNPMLAFVGKEQTGYDEIVGNIEQAKSQGAEKIVFAMDTPGGTVNGMTEAMEAVSGAGVPTETVVTGRLASAGYILGSQSDVITASNELNMIGSVGVVQDFRIDENVVSITNPESPRKNPSAATDEGKKEIQATLSDVYGIVAKKIADGRGVSVDTINANYGQGSLVTAKTALTKGMIDAIGFDKTTEKKAGASAKTTKTGVKTMDRTKLKAEHPDLFAAIKAEGAKEEREANLETVKAHVELFAISGDSKRVMADIQEMNAVTPAVMTYHLGMGQKKNKIEAHQEEQPPEVDGGDGQALPGAESFAKEQEEINAMIPGVEVEFN